MAAGSLAAPGTPAGPCVEPCTHTDCALTRKMAETPCSLCGQPIGYDTRFFQANDWAVLTHADCQWEREEREHEASRMARDMERVPGVYGEE